MLTHNDTIKRWTGWLLLPLLLFIPFLCLDHTKFYSNSDALFYVNVLSFVTDHLKSGDFYPRWIEEANSGYGSPVMMFYAPLAYLITAVINLPLWFFHIDIGVQLLIGIYASQVASGYTAYRWLRSRFNETVACSGSQLFILLPFKLVYIYLNANVSQLWALAFLPLWMLAAQHLAESRPRAIVFYALAFAAVYYCHPLTVIAFGAVPVAYVLWFGRHRFLSTYSRLLAANLLGIGLCLMQALPQRYYMGWINASGFLSGIFVWSHNFFHVDVMLCAYYGLIALLAGYGITQITALRRHLLFRECWFWIAILAGIAFMTQRPSNFIWEHITLLQYLQFPAVRLHCAALMAVIYLICLWLANYQSLQSLSHWAYRKETLFALIGIFGAATYMHLVEIYAYDASYDYHISRETHLILQPEYKTQWGCKDGFEVISDYKNHSVAPQVKIENGSASITVEQWQPKDKIIINADVLSDSARFTLHQCYIPKFHAYDASDHAISLTPDKAGLVEITLPRGSHHITVTQQLTRPERFSRAVSVFCLLICLLTLARKTTKSQNFT